MYDQLPMQVSLVERRRQRDALLREAEVLRALGRGPSMAARLARWLVGARGRIGEVLRQRTRPAATPCRTELGSSAA